MALSQSVEESLKEAEQSLRNALAFAARQERPMVCSTIAEMIGKIESVIHTDVILDKLKIVIPEIMASLVLGLMLMNKCE